MGRKERSSLGKDGNDVEFQPSAPVYTGTIPRYETVFPEDRDALNEHSEVGQEDGGAPSAPPLDLMDQFSGYESLSFDAVCIPPPSPCDETKISKSTPAPSRAQLTEIPIVTEQEARSALAERVAQHCCWGSAAARDMSVSTIVSTSAYHYELESFTENRETSWAFAPYGGGDIDGPDQGPAPLPWEIPAQPWKMFASEVKVVQVPHTASVKQCHRCKGTGNLVCQECHGKGWTRCLSCHGDGWTTDSSGNKERCFFCQSVSHGKGRQDCLKCNAKGRVPCPPCDSHGHILCYISLTITWKVHTSEHIVQKAQIPEVMIKRVTGQVVYEEEGPKVAPLTNFQEQTISLASAQLLLEHQREFGDQKLLAQRQHVRMVPVSQIHYSWKNNTGKFYIYGYENKVHVPEYPQTCCWGCAIL